MTSTEGYLRKLIHWLKKNLGGGNENSSFYILIAAMLLVFIFGINVFMELAEGLQDAELDSFDTRIQQFIFAYREPSLTPVVAFITDLGDRWAYLLVVGAMGIAFARKKKWWLLGQVLFVSLLSALATMVLKNEFQRERPGLEHLVEIGGLSFPSGHSLSAMAFYGFVIYLIFRFVRSTGLKIVLSLLCLLLILAIGLSRIYLGVHYPSDVLAGFVGGLIWMSFCIILFNAIELWRKRKGVGEKAESEEVINPSNR